MIPFVIDPANLPADLPGAIVTQEVTLDGKRRFRKGHAITTADLADLSRLDAPIHAVRLDPDDIHEDDAGRAIAAAVAGPNLHPRNPVQSRVNIEATVKGLARVDAGAIFRVNQLDGVGVFTVPDRLPVLPGKIVAGAKIAPVAIPRATLDALTAIASSLDGPVLEVKPFVPHRVGVIVTEGLAERLRERFEGSVRAKIAWYGSTVERFIYIAEQPRAVTDATQDLLADGIDLLLTAGGNMMDPLDAALTAIPDLGGEIVRLGAPAHPGSMFWLGYLGDALPVVNLASCSMYSKATVADLVLPWVMAGEQITNDDLAALGYGGLLDRDMGWRFPKYDADSVVEADEP